MHSQIVDLWYPMRNPRFDHDPDEVAYQEEAIAHWLDRLGDSLELISSNISHVNVAVAEAPENVLKVLAQDTLLMSLTLFSTVHVQAVVTFDETQPTHPKSEGPLSEEYWPAMLSYHLISSFKIVYHALHLSRPGSLTFSNAHTFIGGRHIEGMEGMIRSQVADTVADLSNIWPTLCRLDLINVVKWFKSISAFSPPIATTRLQRSFAAFTYLVGHRKIENEGEVLFRAMQGLEAFYCDGIGDLRKQLSDKTQLWLGLTQNPSNLVGKLYDLRSKYVHGSAAMPYALSLEDPDEHAPSVMRDFYSGVTLATRLLVATLQKCVKNNVQDLSWDFTFRIIGSSSNTQSDG